MAKMRRFDINYAQQFLKRHIVDKPLVNASLQNVEMWSRRISDSLDKPAAEQIKVWNEASALYESGSWYTATHAREGSLKMLGAFFRNVKLPPKSKILFLGSGSGIEEALIASRLPRAKCTFIDFSERMHQLASKTIKNEGLRNVKLVLGNMEQLPIKDKSQDLVCAFGASYLTPNTINEARKAISNKQYARFVVEAPAIGYASLVENGGFKIEKTIPLGELIVKGRKYNPYLIIAEPK